LKWCIAKTSKTLSNLFTKPCWTSKAKTISRISN